MKQIRKYAALFAALAGLLIMGCDGDNDDGDKIVSPLTVTNGEIISCDRTTKGSVEIPAGVMAVGDYAFSGCTGVTSVTISKTVRSIGKNAFTACTDLRVVEIPASVTTIGRYAFYNCRKLTDVYYDGTREQWGYLVEGVGSDIFGGVVFEFPRSGSVTIHGKDGATWKYDK